MVIYCANVLVLSCCLFKRSFELSPLSRVPSSQDFPPVKISPSQEDALFSPSTPRCELWFIVQMYRFYCAIYWTIVWNFPLLSRFFPSREDRIHPPSKYPTTWMVVCCALFYLLYWFYCAASLLRRRHCGHPFHNLSWIPTKEFYLSFKCGEFVVCLLVEYPLELFFVLEEFAFRSPPSNVSRERLVLSKNCGLSSNVMVLLWNMWNFFEFERDPSLLCILGDIMFRSPLPPMFHVDICSFNRKLWFVVKCDGYVVKYLKPFWSWDPSFIRFGRFSVPPSECLTCTSVILTKKLWFVVKCDGFGVQYVKLFWVWGRSPLLLFVLEDVTLRFPLPPMSHVDICGFNKKLWFFIKCDGFVVQYLKLFWVWGRFSLIIFVLRGVAFRPPPTEWVTWTCVVYQEIVVCYVMVLFKTIPFGGFPLPSF